MKALVWAVISVIWMGCDEETGAEADASIADAAYDPEINPSDFVLSVDNPLLPLIPGTTHVYENDLERIEVSVTDDTKEILGVTTTVVRDTVFEDDEIIEDTFDWFAQDVDGNVWYFGEDTKEYEGGQVVSTEGSWEAGMDGAKPGIVMYADPEVGSPPYRQEYYPGIAEDMAEVLSVSESVLVPYGEFESCLETNEFTPLEPDVNEHKYYCTGVGLVLEVDVNTGDRTELTEITQI